VFDGVTSQLLFVTASGIFRPFPSIRHYQQARAAGNVPAPTSRLNRNLDWWLRNLMRGMNWCLVHLPVFAGLFLTTLDFLTVVKLRAVFRPDFPHQALMVSGSWSPEQANEFLGMLGMELGLLGATALLTSGIWRIQNASEALLRSYDRGTVRPERQEPALRQNPPLGWRRLVGVAVFSTLCFAGGIFTLLRPIDAVGRAGEWATRRISTGLAFLFPSAVGSGRVIVRKRLEPVSAAVKEVLATRDAEVSCDADRFRPLLTRAFVNLRLAEEKEGASGGSVPILAGYRKALILARDAQRLECDRCPDHASRCVVPADATALWTRANIEERNASERYLAEGK
jgi:hypothetical protein